jgi:hypothetical protein
MNRTEMRSFSIGPIGVESNYRIAGGNGLAHDVVESTSVDEVKSNPIITGSKGRTISAWDSRSTSAVPMKS